MVKLHEEQESTVLDFLSRHFHHSTLLFEIPLDAPPLVGRDELLIVQFCAPLKVGHAPVPRA